MKQKPDSSVFSRRDFLKAGGAVAGAAAIAAWLPALGGDQAQAKWGNRLVRGTTDGQIMVSEDDGQTWRKAADFGPGCPVRRIQAGRERALAQLEFQGQAFTLASDDAQTWYTAGYTPPA